MGLLPNPPSHLPHPGSKFAYSASLKSLDSILSSSPPLYHSCISAVPKPGDNNVMVNRMDSVDRLLWFKFQLCQILTVCDLDLVN